MHNNGIKGDRGRVGIAYLQILILAVGIDRSMSVSADLILAGDALPYIKIGGEMGIGL